MLEQCIQYHDPKESWSKFKGQFDMRITREGQQERNFSLTFDNKKDFWQYCYATNDSLICYGKSAGNLFASYNGKQTFDTTHFPVPTDRIQYLYEVYLYLFGIPQKLMSDAKYLSPIVSDTVFMGIPVHQLTFDYQNPQKDKWLFFINSSNFRLEGYQFYKESPTKDGEYLVLKDWSKYKGILFPKTKEWYWNATGNFFRTDTILELAQTSSSRKNSRQSQ
ncbi:MAG: hypothetical protein HC892_23010 [Saprospiraceae bacterium]|nr:hypothetical protein [Saprospiraceae bacterium]